MIQTFQQQPMTEHTKQLMITMENSRHQGNKKEGKAYQLKDLDAIFLLDFLRTKYVSEFLVWSDTPQCNVPL